MDQVQGFAVPVELMVNDKVTNAALARFKTQALDGYDLLLIEAISKAEVGQAKVLTDDMDAAVVPDAFYHDLKTAKSSGIRTLRRGLPQQQYRFSCCLFVCEPSSVLELAGGKLLGVSKKSPDLLQ